MPLAAQLIQEVQKPGSPLYVLARTAYGEARSDPASQVPVMFSLVNRQKSGYRGAKTFDDLVKQPYQYSAWSESDPNREKLLSATPDDPEFARIVELAHKVLVGGARDPTGGAEMYHAQGVKPDWDWSKLEPAGQFGKHQFYRVRRTSSRTGGPQTPGDK
jgi:spore germination cell wall hydrolase CwlJ-like protein